MEENTLKEFKVGSKLGLAVKLFSAVCILGGLTQLAEVYQRHYVYPKYFKAKINQQTKKLRKLRKQIRRYNKKEKDLKWLREVYEERMLDLEARSMQMANFALRDKNQVELLHEFLNEYPEVSLQEIHWNGSESELVLKSENLQPMLNLTRELSRQFAQRGKVIPDAITSEFDEGEHLKMLHLHMTYFDDDLEGRL